MVRCLKYGCNILLQCQLKYLYNALNLRQRQKKVVQGVLFYDHYFYECLIIVHHSIFPCFQK